MVAVDQLLSWTILFEVCYVTSDALTHFERRTLEDTARRIVVVLVLSLLGSSMLQVFYEQVSQEVRAFSGPVLSAFWIVSLLVVFGCSWSFYHWMLFHSARTHFRRVDIVELVERRSAETLGPVRERFETLERAAIAQRASVEQWGTKVTGAMNSMQTASESTNQSVQWIREWIELSKRDMKKAMDRSDEWARAHRNDAATIHLVSSKLESLVDRASILEEEIDALLSDYGSSEEGEGSGDGRDGAGQRQGVPEFGPVGTAENGSPLPRTPRRLTREEGLANREKGNQALMQFSARLYSMNKKHQASLLHGVPDLVFLDSNGSVKCVGAYKALTLSSQGGATKQRWIPRVKLLAESRMAMSLNKTMVLFVENLANSRIWAIGISPDELKTFPGITTPLMLVNGDPQSEKDCRNSLTSVLQLL
jgi:hypothetical protein